MNDESYIDQVFGDSGLLAARFPGYRPRAQQITLARAVDQALAGNGRLLAEAPTGVGKSVGYGVPAIYHAANRGKRVAIVTANIALQEQLVTKDLPMLQEILPWRFTFAIAKGISNYVCRERFADSSEGVVEWLPREPYEAQRQWADVERWVLQTQKGDLSELAFEVAGSIKRRLTVTSDECLGSACKHKDNCFPRTARKVYRAADLVVTNYHLFFSHLAVMTATEGAAGILPPIDVVIMDEGHNAAEVARDFFGFRISGGSLRHAVQLLAPSQKRKDPKPVLDQPLQREVAQLADSFFGELKAHRQSKEYLARLRERDPARSTDLIRALNRVVERYRAAQVDTHEAARKEELGKAARRCTILASQITEAMSLANASRVYHVEVEGERAALYAKLLDVAPTLRAEVFEHLPHDVGTTTDEFGEPVPKKAGYASVVVTSATLAVSGNFDLFACELGAEAADELVVESPFDLGRQALLVVPAGMPEPRDANRFAPAVAERLIETVRQAEGRTLALFTSYRVLNVAHQALVKAGLPYVIHKQGEAPRTKLIKMFKQDRSSVLLGTASFWEGVDVPGDALSCVLIDKLPFAMPDDPIEDALKERDDRNYFKKRSLPQACIAFRQGFGRLIRSTTDRGVVVCLDRRLTDKPYGKTFIRALGGVRVSHNLDDVGRFLMARPTPTQEARP